MVAETSHSRELPHFARLGGGQGRDRQAGVAHEQDVLELGVGFQGGECDRLGQRRAGLQVDNAV